MSMKASMKRDILLLLDYLWDSERCDYFQWEPNNRGHIFKVMARLKIELATTTKDKKEIRRQLLQYL